MLTDPKTTDLFYARAAQAGDEFRKHTLSFSVAGLGAFFVSLTGEHATKLSCAERTALVLALIAFAIATLSGLFAWYFAGKYFHERAANGESAAASWHFRKNIFDVLLVVLFGLGATAPAVYLLLKIAGASP